ncbi:hypothetical protein AB205_0004270, partial [Aquarana catesbeiana]
MVLNMPVLTQKRLFVLSKTKMLILKYVGLFKNPFSNAHVNVHRVKRFLLNNVWLLLSMLNIIFWTKLAFTLKWGLFTKGKSTLHFNCSFKCTFAV